MKKILITGANSYIGTAVENWLKQYNNYEIDVLDMINPSWKETSFANYDCVYHVAGIAHDTNKKKDEGLYYKVNRDLVLETATKAKEEGVKQFIFMSSMLVYNGCKERNINLSVEPKVRGCYGDSKLQADKMLQQLSNENFKVCIVRPPMIFGPLCKGNFPRLISLARKTPFFPEFKNQRSMLYIDNLCEFIKIIIDREEKGIFFPQNEDYYSSSQIIKIISNEYGKKIWFTRLFNFIIRPIRKLSNTVNKLFGDLIYDKTMSNYEFDYIVVDNKEAVIRSCSNISDNERKEN